jgi:hypothetical protein
LARDGPGVGASVCRAGDRAVGESSARDQQSEVRSPLPSLTVSLRVSCAYSFTMVTVFDPEDGSPRQIVNRQRISLIGFILLFLNIFYRIAAAENDK